MLTKKVNNQVIPSLPFEDYLNLEALSRSELVDMDISMRYYKAMLRKKREGTESQKVGEAVHRIVLENRNDFLIAPKIDRRTKKGKEEYAEFMDKSQSQLVLPYKYNMEKTEYVLNAIERTVENNKFAKSLFSNPKSAAESTLIWNDKDTGLLLKCRPDYLLEFNNRMICVDLKTCQGGEGGLLSFRHSVIKWKYYLQDAFYRSGISTCLGIPEDSVEFYFCVVETGEPFDIAFYKLNQDDRFAAKERVHKLLQKASKAFDTNTFEGYNSEIKELDLGISLWRT